MFAMGLVSGKLLLLPNLHADNLFVLTYLLRGIEPSERPKVWL